MTSNAAPLDATSTCLTDEEMLDFAAGRLSQPRRESAHRH
jgi:hypothetical protein